MPNLISEAVIVMYFFKWSMHLQVRSAIITQNQYSDAILANICKYEHIVTNYTALEAITV